MAINRLPLLLLLLLSCIYHTASFRHIPPKKDACSPSGYLQGIDAVCNQEHGAECCKAGERYPRHRCSPPIISGGTKATLALNSFEAGGDGGGPSACTNTFHSNTELIAALLTGWYDKGSRCGRKITITASNGKSVRATVVDECDSMYGCDSNHGFQPPCRTDIVDASFAVWNALGIGTDAGNAEVKWSDTA